MKAIFPAKKNGFTLVELLVVIVIIASLAAISFTVGPAMLKKARANSAMQNLRQVGPVLTTYATDHEMRLPPARGPVIQPDGTTVMRQWNELCLAILYPETPPDQFMSKIWWKNNKVILNNPLFKEGMAPRGWTPLNSGYGINLMIPENLALASTGIAPSENELLATRVPLVALSDPGRTPLIAACDNFFFRYDEAQLAGFRAGSLKELLSEGKFPVLFVDGHLEAISPNEYLARRLFLVPIVPPP
jgi:prepilin-type N-terminal cleavage/methylation domain-containing protein